MCGLLCPMRHRRSRRSDLCGVSSYAGARVANRECETCGYGSSSVSANSPIRVGAASGPAATGLGRRHVTTGLRRLVLPRVSGHRGARRSLLARRWLAGTVGVRWTATRRPGRPGKSRPHQPGMNRPRRGAATARRCRPAAAGSRRPQVHLRRTCLRRAQPPGPHRGRRLDRVTARRPGPQLDHAPVRRPGRRAAPARVTRRRCPSAEPGPGSGPVPSRTEPRRSCP
jgi:hypothetical protein